MQLGNEVDTLLSFTIQNHRACKSELVNAMLIGLVNICTLPGGTLAHVKHV